MAVGAAPVAGVVQLCSMVAAPVCSVSVAHTDVPPEDPAAAMIPALQG